MVTEHQHLSDETILRSLDGELGAAERDRVREHLQVCDVCAGRRESLDAASESVGAMLRQQAAAPALQTEQLRRRIRQGLAAGRTREAGLFAGLRWALVPLAVMLPVATAAVAGLLMHRAAERRQEGIVLSSLAIPDSRLTPGETRAVNVAELCAKGGDDFDPQLPASVQNAVFQEYGMNTGHPGEYQVDYLVSPQLGGTNSIQNLWPEPYGATAWNARAKDALEQRLRAMVCGGAIDLPTAQQAIRLNWIAAYRKYVGDGSRR